EGHCQIDAPSTRLERSELRATLSQAGGRRWSYLNRETRGSDGRLPHQPPTVSLVLISIARSSSQSETASEKPQSQPCYDSLRRDIRLAGAVEESARSKRRHPHPSGCCRRCVASAPQLG